MKKDNAKESLNYLNKMNDLLNKYGKKPVEFKDPLAGVPVETFTDTIFSGLNNFASIFFDQPKM